MGQVQSPWDVPDSWEPALEAAREGGVLLLIGGVDSGKSTLAAILAAEAHQAGRKTAVVDADIGQASIGPPTCVSLGMVEGEIRGCEDIPLAALDFVGSPSPKGHLLQCATGAAVMAAAARAAGAETVVVDTTGLIAGSAGRGLKSAKVRLTGADVVIALQRDEEAEHLLAAYARRRRPRVVRLACSRKVKPRTREERAARRQRRLAAYLAGGHTMEVSWEDLPLENTALGAGEPAPGHVRAHAEEMLGCEVVHAEWGGEGLFVVVSGRLDSSALRALGEGFEGRAVACEVSALENRLAGLLGEQGETLGLGIVERVDFAARRLHIYTPLKEVSRARGVRMGAIQVARDGTQLAWNQPGDLG